MVAWIGAVASMLGNLVDFIADCIENGFILGAIGVCSGSLAIIIAFVWLMVK